MENQTALALIEIAARLTTSTQASKAQTASAKAGKLPTTEEVFADCLTAVKTHFADLSRNDG